MLSNGINVIVKTLAEMEIGKACVICGVVFVFISPLEKNNFDKTGHMLVKSHISFLNKITIKYTNNILLFLVFFFRLHQLKVDLITRK